MFKKINLSFDNPVFEVNEQIVAYGPKINIDNRTVSLIQYTNIEGSIKEEMFNIIPEEHRDKFTVSVMEIFSLIVPHTDNRIQCTLNFYYQTGLEKTSFYTIRENAQWQLAKPADNGRVYKFKDVTEIASFVAKPGEVWLLDTKTPHAVIPCFPGTLKLNRKAITLSTITFSYQEVLDMLTAQGLV
jgi:hypothetical protein